MSSFRLTNLKKETKSLFPQRYSLSEDLRYLLISSQASFELYNLISRTQALKFEVPKNGKITYTSLENGILLTQYQYGSSQRVSVRDLSKNGLVSYETENIKADILHHAVIKGGQYTQLILFLKGGKFKSIEIVHPEVQRDEDELIVSDVNIKSSGKIKKLFWIQETQKLVSWEEGDNILIHVRDGNQFRVFRNLHSNAPLWEVFEFYTEYDPCLLLISNEDPQTTTAYILNYENDHYAGANENIRTNFDWELVRTKSLEYKHGLNHKMVLLRDVQGDKFLPKTLGIIELNYFNWKILFAANDSLAVSDYDYPTNKIVEFKQNTSINTCGIYIVPHKTDIGDKKFTLCVVGENGNSILLDKGPFKLADKIKKDLVEITKHLNELGDEDIKPEEARPKKIDDLLDINKYSLFTPDFRLSDEGFEFMELCIPNRIQFGDNLVNLIKFLLETKREQYLIDIIMEKKNEQETNDYRLLELELLEHTVYFAFLSFKDELAHSSRDPAPEYLGILKSILRMFSAIIDRKEDEARENERFLGTIGPNEEQILIGYKKHEDDILREYTYVQIYQFCKREDETRPQLDKLYDEHYEALLKNKWELNRNFFISEESKEGKILTTEHNFFIDLFLNDKTNSLFPFSNFDKILTYIRKNRNSKDMKFLIFYIITKELSQYEKSSEILKDEFCHTFELTDQELVFFNGLTRLDKIIEKYILTKDPLDRGYLKLAKEACLCLCSYKLPEQAWKTFVLVTFYKYKCYEELTIFIRASDINWSDKSFAEKLIIILINEYKILQAYDFVSGLLQLEKDPVNNKYTSYFEFFLKTLIENKNPERRRLEIVPANNNKVGFDAFLDISLYPHEKVITERFFTGNIPYSKYYILYLIRAGKILEAVEFITQNNSEVRKDPLYADIIQHLTDIVKELPEPMQAAIEANNEFVRLKFAAERQMAEEEPRELRQSRETLYRSSTLRTLTSISKEQSLEESKGSPEERLGLTLKKPDGELSNVNAESIMISGEIMVEKPSEMTIENSRLNETEEIQNIQKVPEVQNEQQYEGLKPRATKKKLLNYF